MAHPRLIAIAPDRVEMMSHDLIDQTSIVIAHRLSTILAADLILVSKSVMTTRLYAWPA